MRLSFAMRLTGKKQDSCPGALCVKDKLVSIPLKRAGAGSGTFHGGLGLQERVGVFQVEDELNGSRLWKKHLHKPG